MVRMPDPAASGPPRQPALSVSPAPPDPPSDDVLKAVLDITKAELDTEFKIAERYEAKARAFFGFAVLLFGVAQAFVLRSDFDALSLSRSNDLEVAIMVAGVAFAVCLVAIMVATLQRGDRNFDDARLFAITRDPSTDMQSVVQEYIALLGERRRANRERLNRLRVAQVVAVGATAATAVEFVLAVIYFI